MNTQSNVIYLETKIAVPAQDSIASDSLMIAYNGALVAKQIIETQKLILETCIAEMKKHMGSTEVLISPDGRRLAEWKQQQPRKDLNKELLKLNFPLEYELCCETKGGNRPFLLK